MKKSFGILVVAVLVILRLGPLAAQPTEPAAPWVRVGTDALSVSLLSGPALLRHSVSHLALPGRPPFSEFCGVMTEQLLHPEERGYWRFAVRYELQALRTLLLDRLAAPRRSR